MSSTFSLNDINLLSFCFTKLKKFLSSVIVLFFCVSKKPESNQGIRLQSAASDVYHCRFTQLAEAPNVFKNPLKQLEETSWQIQQPNWSIEKDSSFTTWTKTTQFLRIKIRVNHLNHITARGCKAKRAYFFPTLRSFFFLPCSIGPILPDDSLLFVEKCPQCFFLNRFVCL